jgi:hypothetical protein
MKKNVASQLISAQMIKAADGTDQTTGTCNVAVEKDGAAGTGGTATHIANGKWEYAPIQSDTNGDYLTFQFVITGAITATIQVYTSFPQTVDNNVLAAGATGFAAIDTVVDGIQADLSNGTDGLSAIKAETALIFADTDVIGATGAGLTSLATQASVNTIDDFLDTEISAIQTTLKGLVMYEGTIGATGNDTTHIHLTGVTTQSDDELNGYNLVIFDNSTSEYHATDITDFVTAGDLATVTVLPFTPEASVDKFWLLSAKSVGAIADGVWDEALAGHVGADSTGLVLNEWQDGGRLDLIIDDILVDTAVIGAPAGASIAADLVVIDNFVDGLETTIGTAGAGLTNLGGSGNNWNVGKTGYSLTATTGLNNQTANITGTISTVTTLTNLPAITTDWLTAAGLAADAGTEIGTAVWATAARTLTASTNFNDLSAAAVNAEVVDALATDTYAEPTGVPAATDDLATKIGYLYMALRNQVDVTATKKTFYDDGGAAEWEKDLSDNGTTYSESEGNAI